METVYITEENCVLHRCENHLILKKEGQTIGTIPLKVTKTIVILSAVQITSFALDILFDKSIDVVYMSKNGRIKGKIYSHTGSGALIRLAQHGAFVNQERRLEISKEVVKAKIINQKRLIENYKRRYPLQEYTEAAAQMTEHIQKIDFAGAIDEIMGLEGVSAKIYWDCYKRLLKNDVFTHRRAYRPAPDFVNSALNLGYAFLATEITACLAANKFDIEIGFLHSIHYGRNSLALDIMEEFRSPFIDTWLLNLFNRKILRAEHFGKQNQGFYLTDKDFVKFCELYHEHIEAGVWRGKFRKQAETLKKAVIEGEKYLPYIHE